MSKRRNAAGGKQASAPPRHHASRGKPPPPWRSQAPFAVTSDGKFLVNVSMLDGRELLGRRLFIGAELTPGEQRTARIHLGKVAYDVQAGFIERFEARTSGQKPESP
jgi:hypothetical protein